MESGRPTRTAVLDGSTDRWPTLLEHALDGMGKPDKRVP